MFETSDVTNGTNGTNPLGTSPVSEQFAAQQAAILALGKQFAALQGAIQGDQFQTQAPGQRSLSVGSRGTDVAQVQASLQSRGYFNQSPTGYFGKVTQNAVRAFQRDNGIGQTGVVGPQTRAALSQGTPLSGLNAMGVSSRPPVAGANQGPGAQTNGNTPTTHVNTPFYSMKTSNDCYTQARAMAAAAGANVPRGLNNGIQVETKSTNGTVSLNAANAQKGRNYIDSELAAGRPVMVGVMHPGGRHNLGMADHFVTITGSGTDAQGRGYYTFNDPGSKVRGSDQNPANRFYVGANGNLFKPGTTSGSGYVVDRAYTLAWVGLSSQSRH